MELQEFLDKTDLSQYEKQVYRTLVQIGISKSQEISTKSKVSYGRIYEILSKLEMRGLIQVIETKPKKFEAFEPKIAFKRYFAEKKKEIELLQRAISTIKKSEKKVTPKKDITTILHGKQKQQQLIGEMHERAKTEILIVPGIYIPSTHRHIYTMRALKRGVHIQRIIRDVNKKNKKAIQEAQEYSEEIKYNFLPGLRLFVVDETEALLSIVDSESEERISIHTNNPKFSKSMKTFFKSLWEESKTRQ